MAKSITRIDAKKPDLLQRKRVAAYARVSMDTERLMHSLSVQVSYYSELIQNTPGWEYAGVYADEGITGTKMDSRPEFIRMLADCEAGKIDIILTKSLSRFARNTVDDLPYPCRTDDGLRQGQGDGSLQERYGNPGLTLQGLSQISKDFPIQCCSPSKTAWISNQIGRYPCRFQFENNVLRQPLLFISIFINQ